MKIPLFFFPLALLTCATLQAQQSAIRGEVSIINSQYETKVRQYVANAQVEEDFGRSQSTTTDAAGLFRLVMVGVKEKESITFTIKKEGLEVVNIDALSAVAGQNAMVKVYMATPQKIAEYKRQYYQIGKTSAEKALEEKLKKLQTERQALLAGNNADKTRIRDLETQLGLLEAQRARIDEDARELARRYAPINLDDTSPLYQEAFSWFQKGDLAKALEVLRQADLAGQARNILAERAKIDAAQRELQQRDSLQKQRTVEVLNALQLKADLHQSRFEWDSTTVCFEWMLELDSLNFDNLFRFAYFLQEQNQYRRSINLYEKALPLTKNKVERAALLNNLGVLYSDNQKMPQAEKAYNEALSIRRQLAEKNPDAFLPDVAMTLNNLGVFFETRKKYPDALQHYEEALRLRQTAILSDQGHFFQEWVRVLRNIVEVKDSTEAKKDFVHRAWAGRLLSETCDRLKGIDERLKPIAVQEYGSLSWWALFARDYPLAERAALRCLELDPKQTWVYSNLGHAHLLRGELQKAKAAYAQLKGKKDGEGKDYKLVLEEDFQALEAEGITHKGMAEIRRWLKETW